MHQFENPIHTQSMLTIRCYGSPKLHYGNAVNMPLNLKIPEIVPKQCMVSHSLTYPNDLMSHCSD